MPLLTQSDDGAQRVASRWTSRRYASLASKGGRLSSTPRRHCISGPSCSTRKPRRCVVPRLGAARTTEAPATGNLRTAAAINAQAAALAAAAKLRAAEDERRQAKRSNLADKLTAEAKALAELKIEKAQCRRPTEAGRG